MVEVHADDAGPGRARGITVAERPPASGVTVSALHFYEAQGLISARRAAGNQRRYPRAMLRRVAFIRASQRVGIPLARIKAALDTLPARRTPTALGLVPGCPRPVAVTWTTGSAAAGSAGPADRMHRLRLPVPHRLPAGQPR